MELGVQTHFSQGWSTSLFDTLDTLGIGAIRDCVRWANFETARGTYSLSTSDKAYLDLAASHDIDSTIVLALDNALYDQGYTPYTDAGRKAFAAYAVNLIAQSNGAIKTVEVWNEANGDNFVTGPATSDNATYYAALLKETYTAIKAAFPEVTVIGGAALTVGIGWFDELFRDGALNYMDAVAVHPYRSHPEYVDREIGQLNALMDRYGGAKPIHATEFGASFPDAADAPGYLIKAVTLMASAHVASASWYSLLDEAGLQNMGLIGAGGIAKPALAAFEIAQNELLPLGDPTRLDLGDSGLFVYEYSATVHVVWGNARTIDLGPDASAKSATGQALGSTITVGSDPVIVEGAWHPAIGASAVLTNSFTNFYDSSWTHLSQYSSGSETVLSQVDWTWTSYLGDRYAKPLMVTPDSMTPGGAGDQPIFAVDRYTATEDTAVALAGTLDVSSKSVDGVELRISIDGGIAFSKIIQGHYDLSGVVLSLHKGDTVDIALGPNRGTDGDVTAVDVDLLRLGAGQTVADCDKQANFVDEAAAAGTRVGIVAKDAAAVGAVSYSLTNANLGFAIDPVTGVVTATGPFAASGQRALTVASTASDGHVSYGTFLVSIGHLITGTSGNDTLRSTAADDRIVGNQGNDLLYAGAGKDTLVGGLGNDSYYVNASTTIVEAAGEGTDRVVSAVSWTLGDNLENLTLVGTAAVDGTGNALNNWLEGNAAANVLTGGAGDDGFLGKGGADTFVGGVGNDSYYIRNAGVSVVEAAGEGTDQVFSMISYALTGNVENLTLEGTAAIDGTGNDLANRIQGNSASNTLIGGGGNDVLLGMGGSDRLIGGTGDDTYYVSSASTIVEKAGEGTDRVVSSVSFVLSDNVETLTLTGTGAINGTGNSAANRIEGNAGNNVINGGGGDDTLVGNGGSDRFVFNQSLATAGVDSILDFDTAHDRIALDHGVFKALGVVGPLPVSALEIGSIATKAASHLLYDNKTGWVSYDADGAGGAAAVHFATLKPGLSIHADDFVIL